VSNRFKPPAGDAVLVASVARGDIAAFGALYDRYARDVYALAAHALGADDAEEIVQDVFVRLWRSADQFDPQRGSFTAWLMSIARHRVVDELRRRRLGPTVADTVDDLLNAVEDPVADVEEEASLRSLRELVLTELQELPPEQRRAVVLAYFGGMSQREISRELGWPLGTVKKRIHLGLRKLRVALYGEFDVEKRERRTTAR
jgi:RNA polymerase sigma-70 factor (ECF subfamily)